MTLGRYLDVRIRCICQKEESRERKGTRERRIGEQKDESRQQNINERESPHTPNTVDAISKTRIRKDCARIARNEGTTQLCG